MVRNFIDVRMSKAVKDIETLLNRITPTSKFQPDSLGKPLRKMNDPVPRDKRMQRADLIRVHVARDIPVVRSVWREGRRVA